MHAHRKHAPVLLASLLALTPSLRSASAQSVPLDPASVLRDAAAYYRRAPSAETLTITHTLGADSRSESLLLAIDHPTRIRIDFGPMTAWFDGPTLRITHSQDMKGYLERPILPEGELATLASLLPPLPLPQLALARAGDPTKVDLTPYTGAVTWTSASLHPDQTPAAATLRGVAARAELLLTTEARTGRILRLTMRADNIADIDIRVTPVSDFDFAHSMTFDTRRRHPVLSIAELRPRAGDSAIGDPLPPLFLLTGLLDEEPHNPQGPCAILFFDSPAPEVALARDALAQARARRPALQVWPVFATSLLESRLSYRLDEAARFFTPMTIYHTFTPQMTVERFSEASKRVLVIADDASIIRRVIALPPLPLIPATDQSPDQSKAVAALARTILEALSAPVTPPADN